MFQFSSSFPASQNKSSNYGYKQQMGKYFSFRPWEPNSKSSLANMCWQGMETFVDIEQVFLIGYFRHGLDIRTDFFVKKRFVDLFVNCNFFCWCKNIIKVKEVIIQCCICALRRTDCNIRKFQVFDGMGGNYSRDRLISPGYEGVVYQQSGSWKADYNTEDVNQKYRCMMLPVSNTIWKDLKKFWIGL